MARRKELYQILRCDYRDDNRQYEVIANDVTEKNIDSIIKEDVEKIKKLPEVYDVDYISYGYCRAIAYTYDIDEWWIKVFEWEVHLKR